MIEEVEGGMGEDQTRGDIGTVVESYDDQVPFGGCGVL